MPFHNLSAFACESCADGLTSLCWSSHDAFTRQKSWLSDTPPFFFFLTAVRLNAFKLCPPFAFRVALNWGFFFFADGESACLTCSVLMYTTTYSSAVWRVLQHCWRLGGGSRVLSVVLKNKTFLNQGGGLLCPPINLFETWKRTRNIAFFPCITAVTCFTVGILNEISPSPVFPHLALLYLTVLLCCTFWVW